MKHSTHYMAMFYIMILSGLLSTMNVWADQWEDMRLSLNDLYMILLMTGWMFLFMGIYDQQSRVFFMGLFIVIAMLWCIRTQYGITTKQYIRGMIPHHSMAVHMSKRLLLTSETSPMNTFVANIIDTQKKEIEDMKRFYSTVSF